ncbi:MAG TPA: potassium channel family protein [Solirubrobacterales bacterium]|nr:potassium channel family protein [Solirubrobacterales bacterium]
MPTDDARPRRHLPVDLPGGEAGPIRKILFRLVIALALIALVAVITYLGREGYVDPEDETISLLDAFYYSTVSITTTGYGDVRPASDEARLLTTVLVTPARILFLILLVGTTLEILAERSRTAYRIARWRRHLKDHTIICGYGVKGRTAARTLMDKGTDPEEIVVIEPKEEARTRATADGLSAVDGSADRQEVLLEAGVRDASALIVAPERDDTAVLITLTARELNPRACIVAAVREEENVHLLHQSGANSVITSSGAAGRLLGLSTHTPQITEVMEDLMTVGEGLDLSERTIGPEEAGPTPAGPGQSIMVAIVRDGEVIRFGDPRVAELQAGDRVLELFSHRS